MAETAPVRFIWCKPEVLGRLEQLTGHARVHAQRAGARARMFSLQLACLFVCAAAAAGCCRACCVLLCFASCDPHPLSCSSCQTNRRVLARQPCAASWRKQRSVPWCWQCAVWASQRNASVACNCLYQLLGASTPSSQRHYSPSCCRISPSRKPVAFARCGLGAHMAWMGRSCV